jgi:hypothetical protein
MMEYDHLRLGELFALVEKCPLERRVLFDFGGLSPRGMYSYRGYYDDLAIGYVEDTFVSVAEFLNNLRAVSGSLLTKYRDPLAR